MASQFNFRTVLGLDASRFSKNLRKAQAEFARFTSTITTMAGALGASLGLGALVSKLKDTATDLSVANATLENTFSNGVEKYAAEMGKLQSQLDGGKITQDEYNKSVKAAQSIFTEYGDAMDFLQKLSTEYHQEIVSLTHSFANFHAAAEQMNISFETQKKVYEAMTKAATYFHLSSERTHDAMVAIEQMMSKGKVTAEELRRQLGNNLPGAFGYMSKAIGVSTSELESLMKAGKVLADEDTMGKFAKKLDEVTNGIQYDSLQLAMNDVANAWTRIVQSTGFEQKFTKALQNLVVYMDKFRQNINSIKVDLVVIASATLFQRLTKSIAGLVVSTKTWKDSMTSISKENRTFGVYLADGWKRGIGGVKNYFTELKTNWVWFKKINFKQMGTSIGSMFGPALVRSVRTAGAAIKSIFTTIQGFLASNAIGIAILAIGEITGHIMQFAKATRDAKNTYGSLMKDFEDASNKALSQSRNSDTIASIQYELNKLKELKQGTKEYGDLVKDIYTKMDMKSPIDAAKKSWEDVNKTVEDYIKHLDDVAMMQVYTSQIANLSAQQKKLERDIANYDPGFWQKMWDSMVSPNFSGMISPWGIAGAAIARGFGGKTGLENLQIELEGTIKTLDELKKARNEVIGSLTDWNKAHPTGVPDDDKNNKGWEESKDKFAKIVQKYKEESNELNNQLKNGAVGIDEYAKAMDKIVLAAGKGIKGFKNYTSEAKKYGKEVEALTDEIIKKYPAAHAREFIEGLEKGNTAKEIENAINKEVEEFQKALEKELNERLELDIKTKIKVDAGDTPKIDLNKDRGLFDYKNTGKKLYEDDYNASKAFVSELEKEISLYEKKQEELGSLGAEAEGYLQMLKEQLAQAAAATDNFKAAMDFSEISADIEKYQKELLALGATGIKDLATSMDRIVKGAESMKSVFEDDDSSGWDKFMAVFNEIVQVVDTMVGIYQFITKYTEKNTALEGAKLALQTAGEAAIAAQLVTEKAMTKELKQQAAAQAAISAMKLPFPENVGALAANMAAIEAAFATSKAFANGGVIDYGSASGDRTLARVNKGEMVLNKSQQATLFNALQSGSFGTGNVQFKIKGADLVGTIENYQSRMRG